MERPRLSSETERQSVNTLTPITATNRPQYMSKYSQIFYAEETVLLHQHIDRLLIVLTLFHWNTFFTRGGVRGSEYKTEDNVWVYKLEITKELKAQVFVVVFKNWSISDLGSVSLYIYSANPLWRNVLLLWKIIASDISDKSFLLSQKPDLSWRKIRYWNFFTQLLNTWEWLLAGNGCWV